MSVLAARLRPRWEAAVGKAAVVSGTLIGKVGRSIPGVGGPLLVCYGLYEAWEPLGIVTAGAILWLVDRRVP